MKAFFISHKPPYPIIDGGCHAMDRMLRDFILAYPEASITYLYFETEKHPGEKNASPSEFNTNVKFIGVPISTKINPFSAFIHLFNGKSYNITRFIKENIKNQIEKLLSENDYELVLFESIFSGGYVDEIKSYTKAKLVYRAHNVEHKIWEDLSAGETNPLKKWYLKHLAKKLKSFELQFLNKIHLIMSISEIDQAFFLNHSEATSEYIPVSMKSQTKTFGDFNSLCFLGAFNWLPNKEGIFWFVNNIFKELTATFPELTLQIAGSFSNEISSLSEKPNIQLHGFVDSSTAFISTNGIFVAPLLSGSGVKMKVLEAMSLGVPCVLSNKAAEGLNLPSIIPVCKSKADFIEKLSLLLKDKELCETIGKAGQRFIETEFSSELVSKKLIGSLKI